MLLLVIARILVHPRVLCTSFGLTLGSFGFAMLWAFASCEGRMVRLSHRLFVSNLEPGTREDWVRKLLGFLAELRWRL